MIEFKTPDADAVAAAKTQLQAVLAELEPQLEQRGAVGQLTLGPHALFAAALQQAVDRGILSLDLAYAAANPDLVDADLVAAAAANFGVVPRAATPATGLVEIVLSDAFAVSIPAGFGFDIGGRRFTALDTYSARTAEDNVLSDTDRPLRALRTGNYSFTVPVTAAVAGEGTPVRRGTLATPDLASIDGFVEAIAAVDFTEGLPAETTASVAERGRIRDGLSLRAWSTRPSVAAAIRAEPAFAGVRDIAVVGPGDPEFRRLTHPVTGIVGPGTDVYVRTALAAVQVRVELAATFVEAREDGGVWQIAVDKAAAPGFYTVAAVHTVDDPGYDAGLAILSETRSYVVPASEAATAPTLRSAVEAAYGPYQTATLQILDPDAKVDVSGQTYVVTFSTLPLVKEIQDYLLDDVRRPTGGDVHVRAAIPCTVQISVLVEAIAGVVVDETAVRSAAAAAVNAVGLGRGVYRAAVEAAVAATLPTSAAVRGVTLRGVIRRPDSTRISLPPGEVLRVPDGLPQAVSRRTVAFFADAESVAVTVTRVEDV